mgnify:CR=1 FL=1
MPPVNAPSPTMTTTLPGSFLSFLARAMPMAVDSAALPWPAIKASQSLSRGWESRKCRFCGAAGRSLAPPGQQLVGVALMADVKQQLVLREVQHAVQGHCQLHNARFDDRWPPVSETLLIKNCRISSHRLAYRTRAGFYFSGRIDALQQGIAHIRTSFLHHRHGKAQHNAERRTGHHFDRRMADHFLQLFAVGQLELLKA